jgi:hypothetical protein
MSEFETYKYNWLSVWRFNCQIRKYTYNQPAENIGQDFNILKATGYVMHQQFNIQQMYAVPTLYLCVLYLSDKKQRLVPLTL